MARLRWSPEAVKDLEGICEYIGRDSLFCQVSKGSLDIVAIVHGARDFKESLRKRL